MARQSWELLDWPHLCRCLLFARPITFAARKIRTSGHLVETQSLDSAWRARHGLHPDLLRRVAWLGSGGSFRFPTRPLRWKRDRSLASTPGSAELTSATTIRSTS